MKSPAFYRISTDDNNQPIYNYVIKNQNTIYRKTQLNFKFNNFAINNNCLNTDEELLKFRSDIIRLNNEIKSKACVINKHSIEIDIFQYSTINKAVNDIFFNNINHNMIQNIPKIDFKELNLFQNCLSCGLMTMNKKYIDVERNVMDLTFLNSILICYKK